MNPIYNEIKNTFIITIMVFLQFKAIAFASVSLHSNYTDSLLQHPTEIRILLNEKSDSSTCSSWKLYRFECSEICYQNIIAFREENTFYNIDEDKKQVIIQKNLPDNYTLVQKFFKIGIYFYEISLLSCNQMLASNKSKLRSFERFITCGGDYLHVFSSIDDQIDTTPAGFSKAFRNGSH